MADWLEPGAKLPTFKLKTDDGKTVSNKDVAGKPVVIYFYPKDDTPGCTKEACAFRDRHDELVGMGAAIFGVSGDDEASHAKFREKYSLNFPLLADTDFALGEGMGAYREKNMYGKKSMGIQRSTFLFDADGTLVKVWKRVSVDGHDEQVIEALKELQAAT